jgi:hypothetical protein
VSRRPVLGDTADGALAADLSSLIDTRLLVQANSGGGKSWCLRRLLEQTHGAVQHLVLDPEGEFASLRERYDYVLAARHGGDTAADPRSAKLLAERLLELGVSAIVDLYELKAHDRIRFVRFFLEALVDAPKTLWHPALVVVDEAHVYCPQQGEAESAGPVVDLATRGRKRGFCAVLATQRLSKLHKDAAAECNNKLIGRSALDVDMRRAADELGFTGREEQHRLRELREGQFFAFGPAISRTVTLVKIGPVQTTHPKAGARLAFTAPPPTAKVKALLPKLADLPAEAEARQKTVAELQADVARLRRELGQAQRAAPAPKERRVEVEVVKPKTVTAIERAIDRADAAIARAVNLEVRLREAMQGAEARGAELTTVRDALVGELRALRVGRPVAPTSGSHPPPLSSRPAPAVKNSLTLSQRRADSSALPAGEHRVLTAIAQHGDAGVTREQLSVLTGYKRSSRDTYLQRLTAAGLAAVSRTGQILATDAGEAALGPDFERLPTGDALRAHWLKTLPEGERKVLEVLVQAYPKPVDREAIDEATGYRRSSRDTYLQRLAARKLVIVEGRGAVRAAEELFGP